MLEHVEPVLIGETLPPVRVDGFYWVLIDNEWEVATLRDGYWYCCGSDCYWTADTPEIKTGPRLEPPD